MAMSLAFKMQLAVGLVTLDGIVLALGTRSHTKNALVVIGAFLVQLKRLRLEKHMALHVRVVVTVQKVSQLPCHVLKDFIRIKLENRDLKIVLVSYSLDGTNISSFSTLLIPLLLSVFRGRQQLVFITHRGLWP